MKKINFDGEKFSLSDDEILDVFQKEVTPHGTGGKIPCSSRHIGKKVYVIVRK
jgi:putative transposon-encoded protein